MDDPTSKPKRARRAPAQKAAEDAGLGADVFLHKDAMGGFTSSGRKPKRLTPGDLSSKPRRRKAKAADKAQRTLDPDSVPDDALVVIPSIAAAGRGGLVELPDDPEDDEPAAVPPAASSVQDAARATLREVLVGEVAKPGSRLEHANGISFEIRPGLGQGNGHSPHRVLVPLPGGHVSAHTADLAIELDGGALLVLDVLASDSSLEQAKANGFDALQLRGVSSCYAVLVFVDGHGPLRREQAEALGHGYDHVFGVPADHVRDPARYTALRARVASWVKAAGGRRA